MSRSLRRTKAGLALLLSATMLPGEDWRGVVRFAGQPVPGAVVSARQGKTEVGTISAEDGTFTLENLSAGRWSVSVAKQLFARLDFEVLIPASGETKVWELRLLPEAELLKLPGVAEAEKPVLPPTTGKTKNAPAELSEAAERAADSLLINGSVNNGAASSFAQFPAFGNNRRGPRSLYNGNLGLIANHSALDARNYSLTGQDTPKAAYSRWEGVFAFGGPLKIPGLLRRNGPTFTLNYQWTRNRSASVEQALMPSLAERAGDLAGRRQAFDPATRQPFPQNRIPASRFSPQALALLGLYPEANFSGGGNFNFQSPLRRGLHQDDLQARMGKSFARRENVNGSFAWQSVRSDTPSIFQFLDTAQSRGFNSSLNWRHSFQPRFFVTAGVQYSSLARQARPYFAGRRNIAQEAGITGGDDSPAYWGPPELSFASGIARLRDTQAAQTRNQTVAYNLDSFLNRGRHYLQFGSVHRRQSFHTIAQQDPRGSFAFTGLAAGDDLAGFLLGIPDTSSIAYGNADKYLRAQTTEAFLNDDFRVNPGFTLNAGLRYEYASPASEKYARLINLRVGSDFGSVTPERNLLPRPDRNNFSPRVGLSWRPLAADSLIVRAGYGIYFDSGIYSAIAMEMAQQAPLSRNVRVSNSPTTPLSLAQGFPLQASTSTFGVDPYFRVGYAQNWQLSLQRDLPLALQVTATYNGSKGTRAQQQILPNTNPNGAAASCSACPSGFHYLLSNGNSQRHAGQIEVRRRLRAGFAGQVGYSWAKAIDDAMTGGRSPAAPLVAQNWRDLRAEKARSNFDQRHLLTLQGQYTSGMGVRGGALMGGMRGKLLRDWTLAGQLSAGTGLPLTPIFLAPLAGTGVTGTLRPDYTGAPLYAVSGGRALNPAAVAAPSAGRWGNAGRNSIVGPRQFSLNASLARSFRANERFSMDLRVDALNVLNTVTFPSWNTIIGNGQFGFANSANPMRTLQSTFRARF